MDWFVAVLGHMPDKDGWAFVLNMVLILVIDRRLLRLITAVERLNVNVTTNGRAVSLAMTEIRKVLYNRPDPPARIERTKPS